MWFFSENIGQCNSQIGQVVCIKPWKKSFFSYFAFVILGTGLPTVQSLSCVQLFATP